MRRLLAAAGVLLALGVQPAMAASTDWTVAGIQQDLMCVVCHQRLDQSTSPFADGMRTELERWHDQGLTRKQVLDRMVTQFGEEVLAAPPKSGFNLLAWVVPGAVLLGGAVVAAVLAMLWARSRPPGGEGDGGGDVDEEMDARIDRDLAVDG
jgi:cytochrome c-type biogenesis protein CcmH